MRQKLLPSVPIRRLLIGLLLLGLLFVALAAYKAIEDNKGDDSRPTLGLITSLPLRWPEGGIAASLDPDQEPSAAYDRLNNVAKIQLIDDLVPALKSKGPDILLLAQPRALRPAEFAAVDDWVRRGGKLLVLSDPALAWETNYGIGDMRRPVFTSLMSPLFAHWRVALVLEMDDSDAPHVIEIEGMKLRTQTPGAWQKLPRDPEASASCVIGYKGFLATCAVGKGQAVLVADADLLAAENWQGSGIRALLGQDDFANMDVVAHWIEKLALHRKTR